MRIIDADALIRNLIDNMSFYPVIVKCAIQAAPTIDAVEVVRCKNCKHGERDIDESWYFCHHHGCDWNKGHHFCSYGERIDEETDD